MLGWFPCLRFGGERWWLPLSPAAFTVIADSIALACDWDRSVSPVGSTTDVFSPPRSMRERIGEVMIDDPAMLIFAGIASRASDREAAATIPPDTPSHREAGPAAPGPVTVEELADWMFTHAGTLFRESECYFTAPELTDDRQSRYHKLSNYFRSQRIENWIPQADVWLRVTGPAIPSDWHRTWPELELESVEGVRDRLVGGGSPPRVTRNAESVLQKLARQSRDLVKLRSTFDRELQREKLAAIKQLAYGLSHEINNPLANISTRSQQLQRGETDPARVATLQRIIDQSYRAFEMIADLMFYANPSTTEVISFDVRAEIERVATSFRTEAERLSIDLVIDDLVIDEAGIIHRDDSAALTADATIEGDATMIREAVGVLVRNAFEAIGCQGKVIVSVQSDASEIRIRVSDSGPGLSEEARRHAFDPYYSGREAGRGLGLGLCRAYRISRLHRGDLSLSVAPAGCVATLVLPRDPEASAGE